METEKKIELTDEQKEFLGQVVACGQLELSARMFNRRVQQLAELALVVFEIEGRRMWVEPTTRGRKELEHEVSKETRSR